MKNISMSINVEFDGKFIAPQNWLANLSKKVTIPNFDENLFCYNTNYHNDSKNGKVIYLISNCKDINNFHTIKFISQIDYNMPYSFYAEKYGSGFMFRHDSEGYTFISEIVDLPN